jgi:hypothetical protein
MMALSMAAVERALGRLQLPPGDVQHHLAERAGVVRKVDARNGGRSCGIVVEMVLTHVHDPSARACPLPDALMDPFSLTLKVFHDV